MRKTLFGLAMFVAGTGLASAQSPYAPASPTSPAPAPYADGAGNPAATVIQGGGSCNGCNQPQQCCTWKVHGWTGADYLMFFPQSQPGPAVIASTPAGATVIGGSTGYGVGSGLRIELGLWMNSEDSMGTQTIFDTIFRKTITQTAAGPIVLNSTTVGPIPGVTGLTETTWVQWNSVDGNSLVRLGNGDSTRLYGIFGTKVANLIEDVNFAYTIPAAGGAGFVEDFQSRNTFLGGQIGAMITHTMGRVDMDATATCALGANFLNTTILGANNAGLGLQAFTTGGTVAVPGNIGFFERTVFSVIPSLRGNISYRLSDRLSVRAGYTFEAFTNVQRPGSQIVGVPATFPNSTETYYIHGANFGATLKY
ncbi:MAG: BBP7 family outer membrane beta-barrel protein [Gemmataceae bacterium]